MVGPAILMSNSAIHCKLSAHQLTSAGPTLSYLLPIARSRPVRNTVRMIVPGRPPISKTEEHSKFTGLHTTALGLRLLICFEWGVYSSRIKCLRERQC